MDGGGGEAERLTDALEGVEAYDWLPDSAGLAYLAREPRPKPLQAAFDDKQDDKDDAVQERAERFRQQIWRIGREDKKARLLHPGDYGIGELAVSPDGRYVAFTTNYTGEANDYHKADVWLLDTASGQTRQLTDGTGGKFHPLWTPHSDAVLYNRTLDPLLSYSQENLFQVAVTGGESVCLTEAFAHDLTGWHGVWFDAAGALYVSAAVGTATHLFRRAPHGGAFVPIVQSDEHVHSFHVAPNGGLAFVSSSLADVPELLWLAHDAPEPITLTDLNEDWYERYALAPTELVRWQSLDGLEIEGLLTLPSGYNPEQTYPLLLSLHGGPHGRAAQSLTPYTDAQVYAAAGYAILQPNYRGSEGYGEAFGIANRGDLGGGDVQDVLAGVDWAIGEGIADPDKLGVVGASYGGYLVNWVVSQTPRFRAGVSQFGIFSFASDFANSEAPRWEMEYLGGAPWETPEAYALRSPATFAAQITTPVLLLHGESDANTFLANSQEMYAALRLQNKPVEYVHYPREGHGFSEPRHQVDALRRALSWFDRWVLGSGQPATPRIGDKLLLDDWELTVTSASLLTLAGRGEDTRRCLEVQFVLRDRGEMPRPLTLGPGDVSLTRGLSSTGRSGRPIGLPLRVLGEIVLAEGSGWRFHFTPPGADALGERNLTVPVALVFRVSDAGGTYALAIKDFPPVTLDVPTADKEDGKKPADAP